MQHSLSLTPELQAIADSMIYKVDKHNLGEGEVQRVLQEVATVSRYHRKVRESVRPQDRRRCCRWLDCPVCNWAAAVYGGADALASDGDEHGQYGDDR